MIRILLGLMSAALLICGISFLVLHVDINEIIPGLCIRVGALLAVICLAFPQLMVLRNKLPAVLVLGSMGCLIIIAARPNLGRVVITLATISITLGGILKWLSKINSPSSKRPSRPNKWLEFTYSTSLIPCEPRLEARPKQPAGTKTIVRYSSWSYAYSDSKNRGPSPPNSNDRIN